MGLTAEVYRSNFGDCSNGGISGRVERVTIVNASGPFEPRDEAPAVMLVEGNLRGTLKVVEAEWFDGGMIGGEWGEKNGDGVGPMFGGCYVSTSDSRFSELAEQILGHRFYGAVALHDRYETVEQYAAMSD